MINLIRIFLGTLVFLLVIFSNKLEKIKLSLTRDCFSCKLIRKDLSNINVQKSNLSLANLIESDFSKSNLTGSILVGSILKWANLSGANLSGSYLILADFSGANLSNADLSNVRIWGSGFENSNLSGVDFKRSEFIKNDFDIKDLADYKLDDVSMGILKKK